jgi:transcriptional regulator with XRE-family HTH domain
MQQVALQENFIANLRAAMVRLGLTQEQLSEKSGVHYTTVSRILNGQNEPSFKNCERLARAVKIDPPKIFSNPR